MTSDNSDDRGGKAKAFAMIFTETGLLHARGNSPTSIQLCRIGNNYDGVPRMLREMN
jgi:hypothetical protein